MAFNWALNSKWTSLLHKTNLGECGISVNTDTYIFQCECVEIQSL